MNKDIIKINNNLYGFSNEKGKIRVVSIQPSNDNQEINEIFKTENDIEQLEIELKNNQENLKKIKEKTIFGEIMNVLTYISLITLYLLISLSTTGKILVLGHTYLIFKGLNCTQNGTRIGRFLAKRKARKNIEIIEPLLKEIKNNLEELKRNNRFKELSENNENISKNQDYSYKFNPYEEHITYQDEQEQIQILRLKRKPIKEIINSRVDN